MKKIIIDSMRRFFARIFFQIFRWTIRYHFSQDVRTLTYRIAMTIADVKVYEIRISPKEIQEAEYV